LRRRGAAGGGGCSEAKRASREMLRNDKVRGAGAHPGTLEKTVTPRAVTIRGGDNAL